MKAPNGIEQPAGGRYTPRSTYAARHGLGGSRRRSTCCPLDTCPSPAIRFIRPNGMRVSRQPEARMSESPDRVLIAGGGIAGLATAVALSRHGIPSLVLERRDEALDAGLGINLPGNAVSALGALGLGDGLERLGAPIGRREYRNRRGRLLFSVDEDAFWGLEARPRCVLRGELMSLLRTAVPQGAVRLGAEVCDMVETPDRVSVELGDGTLEHGALLVGADGVRSTVRALAGSSQAPRAAVLSRSSWRFVTHNSGIDCWVVWSGGADTVLFIPVGGGRLYGWVTVGQAVRSFDEVTAAFDDFPREVRDVLASAAAERVPPFLSPLEEVRPMAWTHGRVVLVGDAAHATAPVWAQGAALAVEDGIVLAEILDEAADWNDAGRSFERRRRARVEHVQIMTDRLSRATRLPPWLRDPVLRTVGNRSYRATYEPLRTPPS